MLFSGDLMVDGENALNKLLLIIIESDIKNYFYDCFEVFLKIRGFIKKKINQKCPYLIIIDILTFIYRFLN